jgi:hypothetical protein
VRYASGSRHHIATSQQKTNMEIQYHFFSSSLFNCRAHIHNESNARKRTNKPKRHVCVLYWNTQPQKKKTGTPLHVYLVVHILRFKIKEKKWLLLLDNWQGNDHDNMPSILTTVVYSPTGNLYGNVNRQSRRPPPPTQLTSNPHYTPSGLLPQKTTKTNTERKEKEKKKRHKDKYRSNNR